MTCEQKGKVRNEGQAEMWHAMNTTVFSEQNVIYSCIPSPSLQQNLLPLLQITTHFLAALYAPYSSVP